MRREFELGDVIAERRAVFEATPGWTRDIRVKIGRPVLDPVAPHETWVCPFQIQGLGSGRVMGIFGIDAMQALLLAVHTIPAELACYIRDPGGRFLHLGGTDTSFVHHVGRFSKTLATHFREKPSNRRCGRRSPRQAWVSRENHKNSS